MKTHLALLRGINVSGQKLIKMEDFRKLLENKGFINVQTYIQSGNVFFDTDENNTHLAAKISEIILNHYGFEVTIVMIAMKDLEFVLNNNPFHIENEETKQLYISFLTEKPTSHDFEELKKCDFKNDVFTISDRFLFLKYGDSAANTKLDNKIIEKKLKVTATTRNWNTTNKLFQIFKDRV